MAARLFLSLLAALLIAGCGENPLNPERTLTIENNLSEAVFVILNDSRGTVGQFTVAANSIKAITIKGKGSYSGIISSKAWNWEFSVIENRNLTIVVPSSGKPYKK